MPTDRLLKRPEVALPLTTAGMLTAALWAWAASRAGSGTETYNIQQLMSSPNRIVAEGRYEPAFFSRISDTLMELKKLHADHPDYTITVSLAEQTGGKIIEHASLSTVRSNFDASINELILLLADRAKQSEQDTLQLQIQVVPEFGTQPYIQLLTAEIEAVARPQPGQEGVKVSLNFVRLDPGKGSRMVQATQYRVLQELLTTHGYGLKGPVLLRTDNTRTPIPVTDPEQKKEFLTMFSDTIPLAKQIYGIDVNKIAN